MGFLEFRKSNHLAIAGFLLPFASAAVTGLLILAGRDDPESLKNSIVYLILVPLILLAGLAASIRSIPLVDELGDKDYAYSGLTLNILSIFVYITSLIYFFSALSI